MRTSAGHLICMGMGAGTWYTYSSVLSRTLREEEGLRGNSLSMVSILLVLEGLCYLFLAGLKLYLSSKLVPLRLEKY